MKQLRRMMNKKKSRLAVKPGFTLIELLIVIAIIGILAGVILVSTSSARTKAKIAAFKSETRGSLAGLSVDCITNGAAMAAPTPTAETNWSATYDIPCSSSGRFSITATPVDTTILCTATVTESGVTYAGTGC